MNSRFTVKTFAVAQERFELELFADLYREFSDHFDQLCESTKDAPEPPLFGSLWPSAEGLAHYLVARQDSLRGRRVLEIGCGLALPSLLCARLGAKVETMDHHPDVAALLARNCQRNQLDSLPFHLDSFRNAQASLGSYDLILGSDILYEPELYRELEDFILRHAARPCQIIIADPGRYAVSTFGPKLKQRGRYHLDKISLADEQKIDIHCFLLQD